MSWLGFRPSPAGAERVNTAGESRDHPVLGVFFQAHKMEPVFSVGVRAIGCRALHSAMHTWQPTPGNRPIGLCLPGLGFGCFGSHLEDGGWNQWTVIRFGLELSGADQEEYDQEPC